jgi:hypothetical protein
MGALCTPGDGDALPPDQIPSGGTRRLTAAGPYLPLKQPIGGSANDEASTRIHVIHPSGLPQPVTPGWNGSPWALHPGLRTPRLPMTHAEAGTVPAHWTEHYTIDISRPSLIGAAALMWHRVARFDLAMSSAEVAASHHQHGRRRNCQGGPSGLSGGG